jgi:hypothetical protein
MLRPGTHRVPAILLPSANDIKGIEASSMTEYFHPLW